MKNEQDAQAYGPPVRCTCGDPDCEYPLSQEPAANAATASTEIHKRPESPQDEIRRFCKLREEVVDKVVGYDNPNDCVCKEGGFWTGDTDGSYANGRWRSTGEALDYIERVVRASFEAKPAALSTGGQELESVGRLIGEANRESTGVDNARDAGDACAGTSPPHNSFVEIMRKGLRNIVWLSQGVQSHGQMAEIRKYVAHLLEHPAFSQEDGALQAAAEHLYGRWIEAGRVVGWVLRKDGE